MCRTWESLVSRPGGNVNPQLVCRFRPGSTELSTGCRRSCGGGGAVLDLNLKMDLGSDLNMRMFLPSEAITYIRPSEVILQILTAQVPEQCLFCQKWTHKAPPLFSNLWGGLADAFAGTFGSFRHVAPSHPFWSLSTAKGTHLDIKGAQLDTYLGQAGVQKRLTATPI